MLTAPELAPVSPVPSPLSLHPPIVALPTSIRATSHLRSLPLLCPTQQVVLPPPLTPYPPNCPTQLLMAAIAAGLDHNLKQKELSTGPFLPQLPIFPPLTSPCPVLSEKGHLWCPMGRLAGREREAFLSLLSRCSSKRHYLGHGSLLSLQPAWLPP